MDTSFDRSSEDLGNIVGLEHVNLRVPDQQLANLFYVVGLGLTRDPYLNVADTNMWINVGRSQFHLPRGEQMRLRGHTGLVIADPEALLGRLAAVKKPLERTCFAFREDDGAVEATCPWGNRVRCYEPDPQRFGQTVLGMPYVEFDVPVGSAAGIARFYGQVFAARVETTGGEARVQVGKNQHLYFRETDSPAAAAAYDGHHIQVYLANISAAHRWLQERGLVSQEDSRYQFRFKDIVDPDDGRQLYTIEHEVRSMTHPMYGRALVNRNPSQTTMDYHPGHDQWFG
jgi:catechol 2,3-dioxygenase-like lactoylglutathione lyase family enzyme